MPRIIATAAELPANYYSQDQLIQAFRELWADRHFNLDRIEQFHRNALVGGRFLALPMEEYSRLKGLADANAAWLRVALELGEKALRSLFAQSGASAGDINHIVSTTITGLAVPSIEARLMNRLPLPTSMKRTPLFGLGCLAGAAGIARLHDFLKGCPTEAGVLLSVELCSLTLQREDLSVANIVSSGLFGDGAAAVLMAGDEHPLAREAAHDAPRGPRTLATRSIFFPDSERVMGWDVVDTGFKIVLSSEVANYARENLRRPVEAFLNEQGLAVDDIAVWIAHPGGPRVITAMTESLGLATDALELSVESLQKVGNLSSASVLFVLQETLRRKSPPPGSYGLLLAMGPAFCAEAVLLQW